MNPAYRLLVALGLIARRRWPALDTPRVQRLLMVELAGHGLAYGFTLVEALKTRTGIDLEGRIAEYLRPLVEQGLVEGWKPPGALGGVYRVTPAGREWLDATSCTGVAASWCPRCGSCTCERLPSGEVEQVLLDEVGNRYPVEWLEVTWPEGGTHRWSPANMAPQAALDHLGLHWERAGQAGCPLHDPTSTHADPEWQAPAGVIGG